MSGMHADFADLLLELLNERGDANTALLTPERFLAATRRASVADRDEIAASMPTWAQRQLGMWDG